MKTVFLLLCLSLPTLLSAADEGLALEGVGILGKQRYAFVNYKQQVFKVTLKETVDHWLIEKIEPRAIFVRKLKTEKDKDQVGENPLLEINMDSVSVEPPPPSVEVPPPAPVNPFQPQSRGVSDPTPPNPADEPPRPAFKPRVIQDEDIPPGHRRVRTPFGDVLVKDDKK